MKRWALRAALALGGLVIGLGLWPTVAAAQGTVVVRPGDTLGAIAQRNGVSIGELVASNGLASPDLIYAGQQLRLPGGAAPIVPLLGPAVAGTVTAEPSTTATTATAATGAPAATHAVAPGETVYHIAARYGLSVAALVAANKLTSADVIYSGQTLVLPPQAKPVGGSGSGTGGASAPASSNGMRRIVITLSTQTLRAYEGDTLVATFTISSGRAWTPTPTGSFQIYSRYRSQTMAGPGYYLQGVPHVQYFVGNYALHGAYWHNLFGTPTSHGCVNLTLADAAWLWDWAGIGTEVLVER